MFYSSIREDNRICDATAFTKFLQWLNVKITPLPSSSKSRSWTEYLPNTRDRGTETATPVEDNKLRAVSAHQIFHYEPLKGRISAQRA